jgi:hypothetical protein
VAAANVNGTSAYMNNNEPLSNNSAVNSLIDQLVQHQHHQLQLSAVTNCTGINNNKLTLGRHHHHQMFEHMHAHLTGGEAINQSPQAQHKFTSGRFIANGATSTLSSNGGCNGTTAGMCQYVDLSGVSGSVNHQPHPPTLPPPSLLHTGAQATTAYLVQTPNGSALLIPPPAQSTLSTNAAGHHHHFIQQQQANVNGQQTLNTFSISRCNPYGMSLSLQNATILNTKSTSGVSQMPHSPSATSNSCFARPDSTASTNVYQTIDTEK